LDLRWITPWEVIAVTSGEPSDICLATTTAEVPLVLEAVSGVCEAQAATFVAQRSLRPPVLEASIEGVLCAGTALEVRAPQGYAGYQWPDGSSGTRYALTAEVGAAVELDVYDSWGCGATGSLELSVVAWDPSAVAVHDLLLVKAAGGVSGRFGPHPDAEGYELRMAPNPEQLATADPTLTLDAGAREFELPALPGAAYFDLSPLGPCISTAFLGR
jgi:hypothetical protein